MKAQRRGGILSAMGWRHITALWVVILLGATVTARAGEAGGRHVVPVPPKGAAATAAESSEAIDRGTLEKMYQQELGSLWSPQIADRLYESHVLMEQYFAAKEASRRAEIVRQLEALKIDPNILGRIVRIRFYWPALTGGVYYINERVGPHAVMYFIGVPDGYDRTKSWPLVIKLPGAHAFITTPPPSPDDVVRFYTTWIKDELKQHPDAVVLMPLLNLDECWGPSYKGMNSVIQPLYHVAGRLNIDPRRVYLMGHGMSGHATWNLALHYPTYFAAINPMSGGAPHVFQRVRMPGLRNIYCVVWHDSDDKITPVQLSREMVKILRQYKYDVDYEETALLGHAPSDELLDRMYRKMRSRQRELYPREVAHGSNRADTIFNRNDWVQVYQMLASGPELKVRMERGTGILPVYQNNYTITASIASPNRIVARTQNVESMRFYLNDQMVDMSRAVTVVVNNLARFEGMVRPSVEEMLKDQVFLGRGWRYFTAYVDVDFGASSGAATRPATGPTTGKGTIEVIW